MKDNHVERWKASPYNLDPAVREDSRIPKQIYLHDVTLRDGEQTPGVVFNKNSRLEIARALDRLGVQRIEAGFPTISPDDKEGVTQIAQEGLNAEIWGFGRCLPQDVESNADCGLKHMILEISISDLKLSAYGISREEVKTRMLSALERANKLGIAVGFMPVDLTRANLDFAEEILRLAVERGGVSEIVVVDSIGVATPETIGFLTRTIREWVNVPLAIHCHNDFGLALANSIAGLKEGARCVHVSVNNLGERAGNTDLAETAMSLLVLYGIDIGIRTEYLVEVSSLVEELSGHRISPTKPIVGKKIFWRESGAVVQQLLTLPEAVEPYTPTLVGLQREVVLGKKSGRYSIVHASKRLGLDVPSQMLSQILDEVKRLSISSRRLVTDEEFRSIVKHAKSR